MAHRTIVFVLICALAVAHHAMAGGSIFSANGVGEEQAGGGVRAAGLGGGAVGLKDTMSFNSRNSALLAYAPRATMRIGGHVGFWNTSANGRTDSDGEMAWQDLAVYLPVADRWRLGFGLQPTLRQDVHTIAQRVAHFETQTENYEERLTWSGSALDVRMDNAYRFSDRLAIGIGAIFTILHDERQVVLDFDDITYGGAVYDNTTTFHGWSLSAGGYYQVSSKLAIGGYFRPRVKGNATSEFSKSGSDSTVKHSERRYAPGDMAVGISYDLSRGVVAVMDVRLGQWKSGDYGAISTEQGQPAPDNPLFASVGLERQGRRSPAYSGFDLWGYRAGLFYRRHYWAPINGTSVEDVGLSLGFSIPVAQSTGWLHTSAELGKRGFDEKKLGAQELFARFSFQVEIGETWFQRVKPRVPE